MIGGAKGIGLGIDLGLVNQYNRTGSQSYIEPEVLDSLVGVWSAYGMTNDSPNRSTIKNKLSNKGGDFVISNAAFKLNSGFGEYEEDFTSWIQTNGVIASSDKVQNSITGRFLYFNTVNKKEDVPSFKVNITLGQQSKLQYNYIKEDGTSTYIVYSESGIYTIPASYFSKYTGGNAWFGFYQIEGTSTIEQIPSFEGAFVTDGIDDLITSTKTVQEMLGGSTEFTAVSMIHLIFPGQDVDGAAYTNYIRTSDNYWTSNIVSNTDKTGIYGYSFKQGTPTVIDNILGDKNDYTTDKSSDTSEMFRANFSVEGFEHAISGTVHASSVAWYWTIIANKVLTTDQINQVIAYFNLDRTLNPDILCNTIKQGITNENHAEFGDKLIDFSDNGRDIQMYNLAWGGNSGIGNYATNFNDWQKYDNSNINNNSYSLTVTGYFERSWLIWSLSKVPVLKVKISGIAPKGIVYYTYPDNDSYKSIELKKDGIYTLPAVEDNSRDIGFRVNDNALDWIGLTITQIPSHAGALCLDGVNDFGKVTGMPIYKDYTFIIDRQIITNDDSGGIVASKSESATDVTKQGAFIFEYLSSNSISTWSYYKNNSLVASSNSNRNISYQSKYSYNGKGIEIGEAKDSDKLWIGTIRDNDERFANIAIYSLMSFPYSMSEFLIERQLKKHKLGTLYPDMVEFRPVIKQDNRIKSIKYYIDGKTANIGQYYPIGAGLGIAVETVQPYMVKSLKVNGVKTIPNADYKGFNARLDSKSPQKITMDIQVDSSLVQWNPVVESNVPYKSLRYYNNVQGTVWKQFEVGEYLPIGSTVLIRVNLNGSIDELSGATSSQLKNIQIGRNGVAEYDISGVLTSESPQKINITIDEYIRYEDIVQPYPILLGFRDENGNEVSWGGKFRVGSTITRIGSFYENNLLDGLYIVRNPRLNGNNLITPTHVVEKSMVFTCDTEYLLDNNEPKCILSPRLLRIPNSSYKILGHIPDISGHGNHGKINNSAYKLNSGVNGYLVDFTTLKDDGIKGIVRTDSKIYLDKSFNYNQGFWLGRTNNPSPAYKVKVSGIPETGMLTYTGGVWLNLVNGINELPARTNTEEEHGFVIQSPNLDWSNLVIEQIGEYEGAYCLDGVNDHVTIPTVTGGGKQVLMKVNNNTINSILYDQRSSGASPNSLNSDFAIYNTDTDNNNLIAYQSRLVGKTYIDGILNTNITCEDLLGVLHNITITCDIVVPNNGVVPNIGRGGVLKDLYSKVALYDFMLFDEISTEDKIKELNEYIGIEAKVELPPYYYDAYGKTNLDEDKAIIQQRGVAIGDYDITNYNHAYDKMSGYGGYAFAKFYNTSEWNLIRNSTGIEVVSRNGYSCTLKRVGSNVWDFGNSSNRKIGKDLNVNIKCDKNIKIKWQLKYKTTENPDTEITVELVNDSIGPNPKSITLPHKTDEELTTLGAIESSVYYLVYFDSSTLPIGEEYTVEMLPLYTNGLVYDGITDYSENVNVPAFTEFSYVFKRKLLSESTGSASMNKGLTDQQRAVVVDHINANGNIEGTSFGTVIPVSSLRDSDIIYSTTNNINGTTVSKGSKPDSNGIDIGRFVTWYKQMVFYKLMLYPKTIPLLQINFLKNLMERDEIIDLNNKIFIQE